MVCGGDMNNPPTVVVQNNKTEQKPEADGRDDKQIHCSDTLSMVPQKVSQPCDGAYGKLFGGIVSHKHHHDLAAGILGLFPKERPQLSDAQSSRRLDGMWRQYEQSADGRGSK